jgi:predicted ATPase
VASPQSDISGRRAHQTADQEREFLPRGNLPCLQASVVGRTDESAQVKDLLSASRLVTLTGVGGVGKTTLALNSAHNLLPNFVDGVWLVELAELRDGSLLTEAVAATLGVRDQAGRVLVDVLVDVLRPQEVLLVLDNCEHLIEEVAKLSKSLLAKCPRLRIIATSRELLAIDGEAVVSVAPLSCPVERDDISLGALKDYDAVELLTTRARAAVHGFALTEANALAVADICTRLEGLPLAIELAAARLRTMSAGQIAAELSDHYQLLSGRGRRGAPQRQQTLTGCIEWSYRLCSHIEQELWSQLSVFSASFDFDAAHQVCDLGGPIDELLDGLSGLVEKSILIRSEKDGMVRLRLLETLRDYGAARLTENAGLQQLLRRRHADYFQQIVVHTGEQWFSPSQGDLIRGLAPQMPNLRQALQYTLDQQPDQALHMAALMRPLWLYGGMLGEGRQWLDRALDASSPEPTRHRLEALTAVAHITALSGDLTGAQDYIAEGRQYLEHIEDSSTAGFFDFVDGFCGLVSGDIKRAHDCCQQALTRCDDFEARVESMLAIGWYAIIIGDLSQASTWIDKGLALTETRGDTVMRTHALISAALNRWQQGDVGRAEQAVREALRLAQSINDSWSGAQFLDISAWIAAGTDPRRAAVLMGAAYATSRASGASSLMAETLGPFHDQTQQHIRAELGIAEYDTAYAEGAALSFSQAANLALQQDNQRP